MLNSCLKDWFNQRCFGGRRESCPWMFRSIQIVRENLRNGLRDEEFADLRKSKKYEKDKGWS